MPSISPPEPYATIEVWRFVEEGADMFGPLTRRLLPGDPSPAGTFYSVCATLASDKSPLRQIEPRWLTNHPKRNNALKVGRALAAKEGAVFIDQTGE